MCVCVRCVHSGWYSCSCCMSLFAPCMTATVPEQVHPPGNTGHRRGREDSALPPFQQCDVFDVYRWFAGKLRSPFLQKQLTQPETPLSRESVHATSRPRAGKALGCPVGSWGWEGDVACPLPSPGSEWAVSSRADLRQEPVPSAPPCSVPAEEEAVYEEPPEQETLYEEPPMVGSLQQGRCVKGPCARKRAPWPYPFRGSLPVNYLV